MFKIKQVSKKVIGIISVFLVLFLLVVIAGKLEITNLQNLKSLLFEVVLPNANTAGTTDMITPQEKFVLVDLKDMSLVLMEGDQEMHVIEVLSKGKPGSAWETPTGKYSIKYKERNHFSSIGEVWMPYSMQFYGNFFIHGWPYHTDGTEVPRGYSGGCIRLSTEDAEVVYDFVKNGTSVTVTNGSETVSDISETTAKDYYFKQIENTPQLQAQSFVIADIVTGDILLEKNSKEKTYAPNVTQYMTALMSLEAVNQFNSVTVPEHLVNEGINSSLVTGRDIKIGDLIYPLILEHDTVAGEVISSIRGDNMSISLMNEKAKALGLNDTHFVSAGGVDEENISTPLDIFYFARHLYNNKEYLYSVSRMESFGRSGYEWINTNHFQGDSDFIGGGYGIDQLDDGHVNDAFLVFSLPLSEFEERHIVFAYTDTDDLFSDVESVKDYLVSTYYYGAADGELILPANFDFFWPIMNVFLSLSK